MTGTKLRQCQFQSGTTYTVGFVRDDPRVRPGAVVTLLGDERRWLVMSVGLPRDRRSIRDRFEAGGITLRRG